MAEPALAVQDAVLTALRGDAALRALVGTRIWDTPPGPSSTFPCVTLGEGQTIPQRSLGCFDAAEHFFRVHVWSREVGYPQCKRIAEAVHRVLHEAEIAVSGFTLIDMAQENSVFMRDPDGKTSHSVLEFRALLDSTDT